MSLPVYRGKPVQASKLGVIVATLLFAMAGVYGVLPGQALTGLILVVFLSFVLAVVITGETILAGYRLIGTSRSLTEVLGDRPMYTIVRAIEVACTILWAAGFAYLISTIPEGPMSGPGAIGLLFMMAGIGLLILGGGLIRSLSEYYFYRENHTA